MTVCPVVKTNLKQERKKYLFFTIHQKWKGAQPTQQAVRVRATECVKNADELTLTLLARRRGERPQTREELWQSDQSCASFHKRINRKIISHVELLIHKENILR